MEPRIEVRPWGSPTAKIMIVGEAPGKTEVETGLPFMGASGNLLEELLGSAGMHRSQAFITNVVRERPPKNDIRNFFADLVRDRTPDHTLINGQWADKRVQFGIDLLQKEIALVKPEMIIALGNVAMWAITGEWGIKKWRGSELQGELNGVKFQCIPTYHPAAVFREQSLKPLIALDLRRVARKLPNGREVKRPPWRFIVRPSFEQAQQTLLGIWAQLEKSSSPQKISADIETRAGHIACVGLAWSYLDAICIPLMCVERLTGYWTRDEEWRLVKLVQAILTHPRAHVVGQNWNYDRQYFHRWHWYTPNLGSDTMAKHHSWRSVGPKGLGHLSSLYCDFHRYWKDDGRLWDPSMDEEKFWAYNCEDCVRTLEVDDALDQVIRAETPSWPKLPEVVAFQHKIHKPVFRMMMRGFRISHREKDRMGSALVQRAAEIQAEINYLAKTSLNVGSSPQMQDFFYRVLQMTPIKKRNDEGFYVPTVDDDALVTLAGREPLIRRLVARIQALRSARTFISNYINMRPDIDGRMRCSFGVAATVSYRFNSSENAFGSGRNLQNVPTGEELEDAIIPLPNIRRLFIPDPNRIIFDLDGDSADLRIVTWESDCKQMKAYFAEGKKPYIEVAREFYHDPTIQKNMTLADGRKVPNPKYALMKAFCHGTNYGGTAPGLASRVGLLVHEAERTQKWYFGMCPEIKAWQDEIRKQIHGRGWIENPFGYRVYFMDRISHETENEALAWTPQSTVGQIINRVMDQLDTNLDWCELLLQVHDSLTGQFPNWLGDRAKREILEHSRVVVPCRSGDMIVPMGLKTSDISWGDCE